MFGLFVALALFEIVTGAPHTRLEAPSLALEGCTAPFLPLACCPLRPGIPKVLQLMNDPDAAPPGDYKFDPLGIGGGTNMDLQDNSPALNYRCRCNAST